MSVTKQFETTRFKLFDTHFYVFYFKYILWWNLILPNQENLFTLHSSESKKRGKEKKPTQNYNQVSKSNYFTTIIILN